MLYHVEVRASLARPTSFYFTENTPIMTSHDHYLFAETMRAFGGHFCAKLADAYSAADLSNKAKILNAWPELLEKYGPESRFAQIRLAEIQQAHV